MKSIAMIQFSCFLVVLFIVSFEGFGQATSISAKDTLKNAHEEEINAWHARRITSLTREHSWLSLIARDWLKEGSNEFASVGKVIQTGGSISVELGPDVKATVSGKPFNGGTIKTDVDNGGPDKVEMGTRAFVVIKRGERFALRMWDSNAEARKNFKGIERFPVSEKWRIEAKWVPYNPPKKIKVATVVADLFDDYSVPGVTVFQLDGKEYKLEPVLEEGAKDLFFIMADATSGKETYGGGRFLYAAQAKDGKVILDFNKAYDPPCAFTLFATCPLPPASNRLTVRIEAGEKKYGDH